MSHGPVRALFFDVGGTLLHPFPSVGAVYASVANRHGIATTADAMERAFRQSWTALGRSDLTTSRKEWWREVVFASLGQENEACFEELYSAFARPEVWRVFPDVEATLQVAQARGLHIGVISNWDERLRPLLSALGLARYFKTMTISCEVGVEKPDVKIFLAALRAAGVTANETVHIGDSYDHDVRGAEAVGMAAILLDRRGVDTTGLRDLRDVWARLDVG